MSINYFIGLCLVIKTSCSSGLDLQGFSHYELLRIAEISPATMETRFSPVLVKLLNSSNSSVKESLAKSRITKVIVGLTDTLAVGAVLFLLPHSQTLYSFLLYLFYRYLSHIFYVRI